MEFLDIKLNNFPLILHNRYFAPDNDYIPMGFPFIVESQFSLPMNEDLFLYIMGKAQTWGMVVYEQDW
jgi:hypothetical protein